VLENFAIVSLFSEWITAECPNPPNSSNFSAFDIPSSSFSTKRPFLLFRQDTY